MKKYPAFKIAILFILSILISDFIKLDLIYWIALFVLTSIIFFVYEKTKTLIIYLLIFFLFGFYNLQKGKQKSSIENILDLEDPHFVTFEIVDEPKEISGRVSAIIELQNISIEGNNYKINSNALLSFKNNSKVKPQYGSIYQVEGFLDSPASSRNPGEFSYKNYLAFQNIYSILSFDEKSDLKLIKAEGGNIFFRKLVIPAREFVRKIVNLSFEPERGNFLLGLLLGDRTNISPEIKNAFIKTGTIHVLAVSGSHVILIVAIIFYFFTMLRLPQKIKIISTILVLIFYTSFTGNTPSVARATLMAIVILLGKLSQEKSNIYNNIGFAAIILMIINPKELYNAGFQLSFAAVLSMIYFYSRILQKFNFIPFKIRKNYFVESLIGLFSITLAAQIGTLPFTVFYFKSLSFVSLFVNIFVVPIVGLIIVIGFVAVIFGVLSIPIAMFYNNVNEILIWITLKSVLWANQLSFGVYSIPTISWIGIMIYIILLIGLTNMKNKIIIGKTLIAIIIMLNISIYQNIFSKEKLKIIFFDVGQGDGALVECFCKATAMIDIGAINRKDNSAEKVIVPYLERNGMKKIDKLFISHPHTDHIGGILSLIKKYQIDSIYESGQKSNSTLYKNYFTLSKNKIKIVDAGEIIPLCAHSKFYIFSPTINMIDTDSTDGFGDLNNKSIVMKFVSGKNSIMFCGDVENDVEEKIANSYREILKSDILKSPHHGSITSSSNNILNFINPKEIVISVGKFNKFGHPSEQILSRYKKINAKIYRTDVDGAILFEENNFEMKNVFWNLN